MDIAPSRAHGSIHPHSTPTMPARDPQEAPTEIRIDSELIQRVDAVCPKYMPRTVFINQAVDSYLSHLTPCDTLIKPSATEGPRPRAECFISNKEVIEEKEIKTRKKSTFSTKRLDPELVPEALQDCADEIVEFWAVKKGTRSEGAATRLFNKLRVFTPDQRIKALHEATDAGWSTVYEPKSGTPTQSRANTGYTDPEFKHPAHQVFTAKDFQ